MSVPGLRGTYATLVIDRDNADVMVVDWLQGRRVILFDSCFKVLSTNKLDIERLLVIKHWFLLLGFHHADEGS